MSKSKKIKKTRYLSTKIVDDLVLRAEELQKLIVKTIQDYDVNLTETDTLSSLAIYKIVKQYDDDFNINFARNGEDARSNGTPIEQKCCRVADDLSNKRKKLRKQAGNDAAWIFHAMGDIEHERYILAVRHKTNLNMLRIYDISTLNNCKLIYIELLRLSDEWYKVVKKKKTKRDTISLTETFLKNTIDFTNKIVIDNVLIYRDV